MIKLILDSIFFLDGGAMMGIVPRVLWSKFHEPDERGRIRLASRVVLFEEKTSGRLWLIESGMGNGWDKKNMDIYGIEKVDGGVSGQLTSMGLSPEDVTDIILTHLHFDHSAGLVSYCDDGKPELTFPSAKIHVQEKQLRWALNPSIRDALSFRKKDIEFLTANGQINLLDGDCHLSDSVSVTCFFGHTDAMQGVKIETESGIFVVPGDLIPVFSHVRLPWIMAYDNRPLITVEEKKKFLHDAHRGEWVILSVHDEKIPSAKIIQKDDGRYDIEVVNL